MHPSSPLLERRQATIIGVRANGRLVRGYRPSPDLGARGTETAPRAVGRCIHCEEPKDNLGGRCTSCGR